MKNKAFNFAWNWVFDTIVILAVARPHGPAYRAFIFLNVACMLWTCGIRFFGFIALCVKPSLYEDHFKKTKESVFFGPRPLTKFFQIVDFALIMLLAAQGWYFSATILLMGFCAEVFLRGFMKNAYTEWKGKQS